MLFLMLIKNCSSKSEKRECSDKKRKRKPCSSYLRCRGVARLHRRTDDLLINHKMERTGLQVDKEPL